tara:strand:+ start:8075 stop:8281 length:207 start_codon:yes stop_codon:yes gene_type:complete
VIPLTEIYNAIAKEMIVRETNCKRSILAALNSWVRSITSGMHPVLARKYYSYSARYAVLEIQRRIENK